MNRIIGHFTFQKGKDDRTITGRYSNRNLDIIFTHQATLVGEDVREDEFIGNYEADWNDINGIDSSNLTIQFKQGTNNEIYTLSWTGGNLNYTGEGFIEGSILIGSYVSE